MTKSFKYKLLSAKFQKAPRKDKENYIKGVDIERHSFGKEPGSFFKKIKEITVTFSHRVGSLRDKDGQILTEAAGVQERWQEYTEKLYRKYPSIGEVFEQKDNEDESQIL